MGGGASTARLGRTRRKGGAVKGARRAVVHPPPIWGIVDANGNRFGANKVGAIVSASKSRSTKGINLAQDVGIGTIGDTLRISFIAGELDISYKLIVVSELHG